MGTYCPLCGRTHPGSYCFGEAPPLEQGLPAENARLYAREFAAEQLRKAAKWCETNGYDEAAVNHLIRKAEELWT